MDPASFHGNYDATGNVSDSYQNGAATLPFAIAEQGDSFNQRSTSSPGVFVVDETESSSAPSSATRSMRVKSIIAEPEPLKRFPSPGLQVIPPVSFSAGLKSVASLHKMLVEDDCIPLSVSSAWIPNEKTAIALSAISAAVPPSDFISADQQTRPGILTDRLFKNPAFDLALRLTGTIPPCLIQDNPEALASTGNIRALFQKGFYSTAANLAASMLKNFDQGFGKSGQVSKHSAASLRLWYYRITSLVCLGQIEAATKEMDLFGDLENPDLYHGYYHTGAEIQSSNSGSSLVPFAMRILHARMPLINGNSRLTLERLFSIRTKTALILKNAKSAVFPSDVLPEHQKQFISVWDERLRLVMYHVVGAAVSMEEFDTAVRILQESSILWPETQSEIWHELGILYCHIGSPILAESCFMESRNLMNEEYRTALQDSLLMVCKESPVAALDLFAIMLQKYPSDVFAMNGYAVGCCYAGKMSDAVTFMEDRLFADPKTFLTEQTVINLCSMYDLLNISVKQRKLRLLSLVCQYVEDGAFVGYLKLDTANQ